MEFGPEKVTVLEADTGLRNHLAKILADAGYQVSAQSAATLKTVLESMPDVIVMGADPPQLDCCDLLFDPDPACGSRGRPQQRLDPEAIARARMPPAPCHLASGVFCRCWT